MNSNDISTESKTISTAAYILPIGWAVAYLIVRLFSMQTPFTIFHLRQGLGLNVLFLLFWLLLHIFNIWILIQIALVFYFLLLAYSVAGVRGGRRLYMPLIGKFFDTIFTFIA